MAERGDGSGSLAFGRFPGIRASFTVDAAPGRRMWMVGESARPVLWEVANARHVHDLVAKAQQTATRRRPPGATGTPTENVANG